MNKEIAFAEWLAENHFYLYNKSNGVFYWKNSENNKTDKEIYFKTETLYKTFKLTINN